MRHKLSIAGALLACAVLLTGCSTAPTKQEIVSPQLAAIAPTAFTVMAQGAVGVAVSKGVKASDIASGAYQLKQFASGENVSVQALTTEIMRLEQKAGLNTEQVVAVTQMRTAFDTIILGYINNGVIAGTAKTTLLEILDNMIAAAVLLGAPNPDQSVPTADTGVTVDQIGPPAPPTRSPAMATLESPAIVGAAASTVLVAALKAFAHVEVSSPVAAGIAVLGSFTAGWLEAH